jgi:glucosylceramidase
MSQFRKYSGPAAMMLSGSSPMLLICLLAFGGVDIKLWMILAALVATIGIYVSAIRAIMKISAAPQMDKSVSQRPSGNRVDGYMTSPTRRLERIPFAYWRVAKDGEADIEIDPRKTYQSMLGFGASLTGSSCMVFNRMPADQRAAIMTELFAPNELNFNVVRTSIGSSDYHPELYSYSDGEADPDLQRFSIDRDRPYVLPMLKMARTINPDLYYVSSPWSPPAWMKPNGTMLGGAMGNTYFPSYANYFVRFVQEYKAAGVEIQAVTVQNEVQADQGGHMPACTWTTAQEVEFVKAHLGPAICKAGLGTDIWIMDHNYDMWDRAIESLNDPELRKYCNSIAWHAYGGEPEWIDRVHAKHPEAQHYFTEFNTFLTAPEYLTDWTRWGNGIGRAVRNWCRNYTMWNVALDENGKPNIGPFPCGGVVTIDSQTHEVTRSGGYYGLAHYSKFIRRGAKRIESFGELGTVVHVAFTNPDGERVIVISNSGAERVLCIEEDGLAIDVKVDADSVTTLTWK